ncbi:hypothetical protein ACEWY4_016560 [Coilia grayii]|uniref:WD repeat-containing protein 70 n=1 Tax=Coilia grayii TaxID=363190 RepID=A0ABD1JKX4_9TELE
MEQKDDNSKDDGDISSVMGFSGFGKKARTFDFQAIFEQTRRTAIERSQRALEDRQLEEHEKEQAGSSQTARVSDASKRPSLSRKKESSSSSSSSDGSGSDSDSDGEGVGPPLPPGFSAQRGEEEEGEEEGMVGPPLPPDYGGSRTADDDDDNDGDTQEEDDDNPLKKIPDTHEITLQHGSKTVSALGLDPSGARLVTGGYDYDVKFWDFAGMDAALQAFRSLQPCECHQIRSLQYSITGDVLLVVAGNAQAKVLDRDGFQVMECVKGDQYIVDMANTKHLELMIEG